MATRDDDASSNIPSDGQPSRTFDRGKAQRAARNPERPGELCRAPRGKYEPHIDRSRCEGKADCVSVCPYGVFEVRRMADGDFQALSFLGRLKSRAHGRLSAYTPGASYCQACGLCVVACPENAVSLVPRAEVS
jgi:NAD-dependent dihydropyrimidine dehydrogenase PreA subunit